MGNSEIGSLGM